MMRALAVEIGKLRRERMLLWTAVTVLLAPALSNVFATAQDFGGTMVPWPTFFGLGAMTMGTWYGILLFGLVASFIFGGEYAQGVAPSMLTAPIRREQLVIAKLIVMAAWIFVLALLSAVSQGLAATALGLDGFSWADVWPLIRDHFTVALLLFLTLPLVGLVAVVSRGVFAPMIFSAAGFLLGMIGGIAGWGEWLPWAMPTAVGGTFLGPVWSQNIVLTGWSWAIAVALFVASAAAIVWWVDHADAKV